jgi:type IV fimbrial biogenesis protein FimT
MAAGLLAGRSQRPSMNLPDHAGSDAVSVSRNSRPPHRQRGVTLIEQIMVLAIIAVLMGIAAPPLRQLLSRNELRVAQTDFIAALQHAREAAVMSGKRTLFCPTRDGSSCSDATRWESGWLLGRDSNRDDQPDGGPLHVGQGYAGKVAIYSSGGRHVVRFHPDGSASGSNITLLFCQPSKASDALVVVVSNAGRIRGAPANAAQAATCTQLK